MSIFLLMFIGMAIAMIPVVIMFGLGAIKDWFDEKYWIISTIVSVICTIAAVIFIGIGMCDNEERVYVQGYLAQKQAIEQSLVSQDITGFERVELVNKVAELNGELAMKKASYELWHHVHYDYSIYDGVEFISLEVK